MRALLDTNVIIDLFTGRPPEGDAAAKLQVMQVLGDIELWVSAKSFTDVFYVMRKENESANVQQTFIKSLEYLKVCAVDADDIRQTAERCWLDFEDCLIDVCAEKVKADVLLTRDEKGFARSSIACCSPKAFFDRLEHEHGIVYEEVEW
ncbi:type II toxin-antitoxin system VapC family toxin [Arabiibacter massiliensis]|uniref:type II toxin-antitoxin system VapC family toxin n=1 Tax=Arabiibacter massiliensis TaxID=1870985 RepID=UPI0009B9CF4F|nr:PIN domain-containing protein [Arabiibacter massiliensis]